MFYAQPAWITISFAHLGSLSTYDDERAQKQYFFEITAAQYSIVVRICDWTMTKAHKSLGNVVFEKLLNLSQKWDVK